MRQWFGVSANTALNTRWTQFINEANYKIIDSKVMDWVNVTNLHTLPTAKGYSPPRHLKWRATFSPQSFRFFWSRGRRNGQSFSTAFQDKWQRGQEWVSYRKLTSRPLLKTASPLLFPNKSTVKHATWSNSCRLDTLLSELYVMWVFSFYFSQLIPKVSNVFRHFASKSWH